MKPSVWHKNVLGAFASGAALLLFLFFVSPSSDNLGVSFAPLILFWALLYFGSGLALHATLKHTRRVMIQVLRVAFASSVTLLVMFRALGDVSPLDAFVLLALAVLGSFYFSRTWQS